VTGFSRDWLRLRAPYDAAARSTAFARGFAAALPPRPRVADLGAGDGANAAWLARYLPPPTRWLLVDKDAALLGTSAAARRLDLATELDAVGAVDGATCSALLDLVSLSWVGRLARWLDGRPFLAALSVDGRIRFEPGDAEDARILAAFAADQRRDKGFGPALGPQAPATLARVLRECGYEVRSAASDWALGPGDGAMLAAMIEGFAAVAPDAAAWAARRRTAAARDALRLAIGHCDVLALRGA
jgi:hypothetical protein